MANKSTMNMKWRLYQQGFSLGLLACGSVFLFASMIMPVMSPEVYGPAVYSIPAEAWASGVVIASILSLIGIHINVRSRWAPLFRVAGYSLHMFIFMALAILSSTAAFGSHMAIYSVFFFSTHMLFFIWVNIEDVYNVLNKG